MGEKKMDENLDSAETLEVEFVFFARVNRHKYIRQDITKECCQLSIVPMDDLKRWLTSKQTSN